MTTTSDSSGKVTTKSLAAVLDSELRTTDFTDASHNGLQVANDGTVTRICGGVDASMDFLRKAKDKGADFCIVHHGISWGSSLARIDGVNYEIISFLVRNNIALYASHLPLDAHPVFGNNAQIAEKLDLVERLAFCDYHGNTIGSQGKLQEAMLFEDLAEKVRTIIPDGAFHTLPFGSRKITKVGIVSGGAIDMLPQAVRANLDCFITGEMNLVGFNAAKHEQINVIAAGHYATERCGVKAVGAFLEKNFKLPFDFIDFRLPW